MDTTDILERYHNYATEKVCPNALLEPESFSDEVSPEPEEQPSSDEPSDKSADEISVGPLDQVDETAENEAAERGDKQDLSEDLLDNA